MTVNLFEEAMNKDNRAGSLRPTAEEFDAIIPNSLNVAEINQGIKKLIDDKSVSPAKLTELATKNHGKGFLEAASKYTVKNKTAPAKKTAPAP